MSDALLANGVNNINGISSPESVAVDSPATPIDNSTTTDIKIDVEYTERESDVRHEPVAMKLDVKSDTPVEDASVLPQVGTPADPDTIPIEPPKGTPPPPNGQLLEDVRMAEEASSNTEGDVQMADGEAQSPLPNGLSNGHTAESPAPPPLPTSVPAVSSAETAVDSLAPAPSPYPNNTTSEHDDHDKPPPAKRARKLSDAEKASVANTGTPPPASVSPEPQPVAESQVAQQMLSVPQWRFGTSTIRTLKKLKDAGPFLAPVDPVALNIPHYPSIVKHPMDFSTVERKMAASNPSKPDPNPLNPRYHTANEFITDVRLIFGNCALFNGPDHPITAMGKRVEAVFDKQIKQMPPPEEPKPVVKKTATPPPPPPPPKKTPVRRPSTSVPVIRRTEDSTAGGRPKREIHPPPPKDLPYTDIPKKTRRAKGPKNDIFAEQFKFCDKTLKELHKKSYYTVASPFYEPVDWLKLDIPQYPKVIKKPMDLSTIRRKLQEGEYNTPEKFREDFKLMIRNSMTFNPPKNPVHEAGRELDRIFDEKWRELPPLRSHAISDEEDEEEDLDSEDERQRMIVSMENQILNMKSNLDSLKRKAAKPEKKEKRKEKKPAVPVASTSKSTTKQPKTAANGRKKAKKSTNDDDVLSFDQKKDLSDTIGKLDGAKLERVIQIIHEGVPEIRDSTEEIELEIDQLPATVLLKLYNFVIRPLRTNATKRARSGKGTGTGGLKRKSMDEDVEAAKIRALEERIKLFDQNDHSPGRASDAAPVEYSEHSSAESSSESSASDSE